MSWWKKKSQKPVEQPVEEIIPAHIGIIMDGNGRWAKKRGLPRSAGHVEGARILRSVIKHCEKRGVQVVTVYAFSTENWRRPQGEIDALMNLLRQYIKESLSDFRNENIRTRFIGDRSVLADDLVALMEEAEAVTADKTGMTFNIALNYGGRDELVHGVRQIVQAVQNGELSPDDITEQTVTDHLYTAGLPDPDIILRPSGEYRLSNFLIWQAAYSEYIFMDILWPDFRPQDVDAAIREYSGRHRRFGGI